MNTAFDHIANLLDISPVWFLLHITSLYQTFFQKSREFSQTKFFATEKNQMHQSATNFWFLKINFYFKMFVQKHAFLFGFSLNTINKEFIDHTYRLIPQTFVFLGIIYPPPIFYIFPFFSGPVRFKCKKEFRHIATLRCRIQGARINNQCITFKNMGQMNTTIGIDFCSLFTAMCNPTMVSHKCLLYFKDVFNDQLKSILIASDYSGGCGPVFVSLKSSPGPRLHGFLFLATKVHEETRRNLQFGKKCLEKKKTSSPGSMSQTKGYKNKWVCREEVSTPPHTWIWIWIHTQRKEVSCKKWESLK
jgi:hypothetical protein